MRVTVTGGAGFVGSCIARRLIAAGHSVRIVDDLSTGRVENLPPGCDWQHGNAASVDYQYHEAVVHAAAYPDVSQNWASRRERDRQWECNANLTRLILERVPHHTKVVLLSTCSVYGPGHVDEVSLPRATSPYAASKLAAEALVHAYHEAKVVDATILRLVNVVGARYLHGHLADFVRAASGGKVHALDDGEKKKSFVHVEDVADTVLAVLALPRQATAHVQNVTSDEVWSWRDSIAVMKAARPDRPFDLTWEERRSGWVGDPDELVVMGRRAVRVNDRPVESGVRDALESLGW